MAVLLCLFKATKVGNQVTKTGTKPQIAHHGRSSTRNIGNQYLLYIHIYIQYIYIYTYVCVCHILGLRVCKKSATAAQCPVLRSYGFLCKPDVLRQALENPQRSTDSIYKAYIRPM